MNKSADKNPQQRSMLITRESLRPPCKRQRTRSGRCETPQLKEDHKEPEDAPTAKEEITKTKCRRQWEQWSEDDQEIFFQGLAEYGKDYAQIRQLMKKKLKLKSEDESKTKEQIRHFYHRTWSKISKTLLLQHENDPKKAYRREIHYMICLGELRKKGVQGLGQKVLKQLDELVTKGSTYLRYKGRNIRLRPPNRFLKKLYRDVNSVPDVTVPKHINIEFLPNSNTAFNFVQKHAFNPRLRFTNVNTTAKFSEVFQMFDKRFTDLYSSEQLILYIYPLPSNSKDGCSSIAEKLAHAEKLLESCEKKQEAPIILENLSTDTSKDVPPSEVAGETEAGVFPRIFGKSKEKDIKSQNSNIKPFLGYWTYTTAEKIHLRTIYLALGQNDCLKFKYEWREVAEKKALFAVDGLQCLVGSCKEENNLRKIELVNSIKKPAKIAPKVNKPIQQPIVKPVVPGVITSRHNGVRFINNQDLIPLRPRPGRKRPYSLSSQQGVPQNRAIVPRVNASSKLLNNAVAVNLIPQPPQLVQYANLSPDSFKLTNSCTTSLSKSPIAISSVYTPSLMSGYRDEVVDEGYNNNEHFKSLHTFLETAAQNTGFNNTPKAEVKPIVVSPCKKSPGSPNLEWLNGESADITLTSFLNVCEMQALQQQQQQKEHHSGNLMENGATVNGTVATPSDPLLPAYHSGDTSHGPLDGLTFELSNQGEIRSKDSF